MMFSAASTVDVVLRFAPREPSHCVPSDLSIKERSEGPLEMLYLGNDEEVEKWQ